MRRYLILISVAFGIFYFTEPIQANQESNKVLTIGSISNSPKEEIAKFQPFVNYLISNLDSPVIKEGQVLIADSLQEMSALINNNKVDIYLDSPFPIIAVEEKTALVPFLRRWKKGVREYNSVIFVRNDSGINTLDELKGKMIAFEEEFSTSSYFLPKSAMLKANLSLVKKRNFRDSVPKTKIGYVFSNDDETTMIWVLKKRVAGGAINKIDFIKLAKSKLSSLKILHETDYVPRQVVAHRKGLSPKIITKIKDVLIKMNQNDKGKAILKAFGKTTKFEDFNRKELKGIYLLFEFIKSDFEL